MFDKALKTHHQCRGPLLYYVELDGGGGQPKFHRLPQGGGGRSAETPPGTVFFFRDLYSSTCFSDSRIYSPCIFIYLIQICNPIDLQTYWCEFVSNQRWNVRKRWDISLLRKFRIHHCLSTSVSSRCLKQSTKTCSVDIRRLIWKAIQRSEKTLCGEWRNVLLDF